MTAADALPPAPTALIALAAGAIALIASRRARRAGAPGVARLLGVAGALLPAISTAAVALIAIACSRGMDPTGPDPWAMGATRMAIVSARTEPISGTARVAPGRLIVLERFGCPDCMAVSDGLRAAMRRADGVDVAVASVDRADGAAVARAARARSVPSVVVEGDDGPVAIDLSGGDAGDAGFDAAAWERALLISRTARRETDGARDDRGDPRRSVEKAAHRR